MVKEKPGIKGFYAIIDDAYLLKPSDMEKTAKKIISGGAKIIQLRAKGLNSKEFLRISRIIRKLTLKNRLTFIVNDRVDAALMSNADGVHLGQEDLPVKEARKLLGKGKIIGLSTHNLREALEGDSLAKKGYIDYISFGPIFPTRTKTQASTPTGIHGLKETKKSVKIPVVAIGGLTLNNIIPVLDAKADAVAVISYVLTSLDIRKTVRDIASTINGFGR